MVAAVFLSERIQKFLFPATRGTGSFEGIGFPALEFWGAVAATAGIFLLSFFFVLLVNPVVPKSRKSPFAAGFLYAVNIGAVGVMVAGPHNLGDEILINWKTWPIALMSIFATFTYRKINAFWIVIGGALL